MAIITLSEDQRRSLEHDTTEVSHDELQTLINARGEEWKKTLAGQEIIKLLGQKDTAQTDTTDTTKKALEEEKARSARLQAELKAAKKGNGASGDGATALPNASQKFIRTDEKSWLRAIGEQFSLLSGSQETTPQNATQMVETIKSNYALMKSKQRENYIQHADDLFFGGAIFEKEYENTYRRGLAVINYFVDNSIVGMNGREGGGKVLNYSSSTAFGILENIANQIGNKENIMMIGKQKIEFQNTQERDKAIIIFLNDANNAIITEDDSYWISPLGGSIVNIWLLNTLIAKPLAGLLKKGTWTAPIGRGINILTDPLDSAFDALKKGGKGYSKNVIDGYLEKRRARKAEALSSAPEATLTPEQKELKKSQLDLMKNHFIEDLYTRHSLALNTAGIADLETFKNEMKNNMPARVPATIQRELKDMMTTAGKYFPLDFSDPEIAHARITELSHKLNPSFPRKIYLFLSNQLILPWIDHKFHLSEKWGMGDHAPDIEGSRTAIMDRLNVTDVEIDGQKIKGVPAMIDGKPAQEVIRGTYEYIKTMLAGQAVQLEVDLQREIRLLEGDIETLKNTHGIPDTDTEFRARESQLAEAKREYEKLTAINESLKTARENTSNKKTALEAEEGRVSDATDALNKAQEDLRLMNDYLTSKQELARLERSSNASKGTLQNTIRQLEGKMSAKGVAFVPYSFPLNISDLDISHVTNHITELGSKVNAYNAVTPHDVDKIDTSSLESPDRALNQARLDAEAYETLKQSHNPKETELKNRGILAGDGTELRSAPELASDVRTKETEKRNAERVRDIRQREYEAAKTQKDNKKDAVKANRTLQSITEPATPIGEGKKTYGLTSEADITRKQGHVSTMKAKLEAKAQKVGDRTAREASRTEAASRAGVSTTDSSKLRPLPDGNLSAEGERVFRELGDRAFISQPSFDAWKSRLPAGYVAEIRDGKMIVRDAGGTMKGTFDPSKPEEAAKLIEKFTKR